MKKIKFKILALLLIVVSMALIPTRQVHAMTEKDLFQSFSSDSYILIDCNSDTVLYGLNPNQKMPVASICKLMTSLLTLERIESGAISLEDKFVASDYACDAEGSQAFLDAGSEYSVRELLKSVIVASANDSAIVLAENLAGTEDNFVKLMNEKAKALGMKNTLYSNATGLSKANQYSTALDTAILLKHVSKYDLYKADCSIWMDKLVHPSGRETELVNTNRLIKYYSPCKCGKTGFTDEAGYCLSAMASKNDMTLIAVALKCDSSPQRFKECMELFNYGFSNFENKNIIKKGDTVNADVKVLGGKSDHVGLVALNDFYVVNKIGDSKDIELKYELPSTIKAPLKQGESIGKIVVLKKGIVLGEINVGIGSDIEKQNYNDALRKIFEYWEI